MTRRTESIIDFFACMALAALLAFLAIMFVLYVVGPHLEHDRARLSRLEQAAGLAPITDDELKAILQEMRQKREGK